MKSIIPFITFLLFSLVLISCKNTGNDSTVSKLDSNKNELKKKEVNPDDLEGTYRVGKMKCKIWTIETAYGIKWVKSKGTNLIFFDYRDGNKIVYDETDQSDDTYYGRFEFFKDHTRGTYIRKDGKEFNVEKIGP